jgi:photosystem II stability/assembly factor-like uncharacterized protein
MRAHQSFASFFLLLTCMVTSSALAIADGASPSPQSSAEPSPSPSPSSGPFDHLRWRSVGPAASGGRVSAVAGSANDPFLYYVGTAGGGVWKSINGGASWDPVFDKQGIAAIGAISVAATDEKIVWVGTGEANPRNDVSYGNGVYKSTDAGKTWQHLGLDATRQISSIAIDPTNQLHVLVGALGDVFRDSNDRGVYETTDGGATWKQTLFPGPQSGISDIAIDPKNPKTVYAGVWQFRREPWTFSSGGPVDGLYKSIDGGTTWSRLNGNGLPDGPLGRIALAISPSNPKRVYALIQSKAGFLWRSDDAGQTWTMVSDNTLIDQRPFYFSHIAVDPSNPDHVYSVSEMAAESTDAGKTFKIIANDVHVDYHSIWIAPDNPKRIMLGEDGGYALSVDGGASWSFSRNFAIGQIYHIGLDDAVPYNICGGFQDNNGWCWPSNSLDRGGITNAYARPVIGGDGEWVVPDPANPNLVWADLEDGVVHVFNRTNRESFDVEPVPGSFGNFDFAKAQYRFNWDSPIAFAPWDPKTVWYGGNVVFQSHDEGRHWTPVSPDLTLNDKSHQVIPGGPITGDLSGAEYYDTILDIEGSPAARAEIWVGTDDGLIQLTRDGGVHWTNVTPRGVPPLGRVETVDPSSFAAGTAFAIVDRHFSGDTAPYIFSTTDFGRSWHSIASDLPADQFVRTVRQDPVDPNILYAGTELGIWISYNGGRHWQSLQLNLPPASVQDIRFQARDGALVIGTHGRSAWVIDDLRPLQQFNEATRAGQFVFAPRMAIMFQRGSSTEGLYTEYSAPNPPAGAAIYFYQAKPAKSPPVIDIVDYTGRTIRHVAGTHPIGDTDKTEPDVTNFAGYNRYVWDLAEDPPPAWTTAPSKDDRRETMGVPVVPGTYAVRVRFQGRTLSQTLIVRPDPRLAWTQADYRRRHDFVASVYAMYGPVNLALNHLDATEKRLNEMIAAMKAKGAPQEQIARAQELVDAGTALEPRLSAGFKNDEDSVNRPGALREQIQGLLFGVFGSQGPPISTHIALEAKVRARYQAVMADYRAWAAFADAAK